MGIPESSAYTLRVMTRKSKFGFGKFHNMTVGDVMIAQKSYIAFAYYNLAQISFSEDILDELKIIRIEKPGTSRERWREYREFLSGTFTEEERIHGMYKLAAIRKNKAKSQAIRAERQIGRESKKGRLQSKNHGR